MAEMMVDEMVALMVALMVDQLVHSTEILMMLQLMSIFLLDMQL